MHYNGTMEGSKQKFWKRVWGQIASPHVSDEKLQVWLEQIKQHLPIPVFWLLGKTQSGKTSLIRALTDNTRVEIGNGFRPCTRTAQMFSFPGEEDCILRFLDTRGLGEVDYDPSEDLALFEQQAHLLIVVMKAMDHAQQPVMDALAKIHRRQPNWPILVVQTALHEGYPTVTAPHILPYPYLESPLPPSIPVDVTRSLLSQREIFAQAKIPARFVAVDFTLPEDGFQPVNYGLDQLWDAVEELLPLGLRGMLQKLESTRQTLRDIHLDAAQPHIVAYSVAAGGAAGVPLPWVDIPLILAIQAKMFHTIASIYHQNLTTERIGEVLSAMGVSFLGRFGTRQVMKREFLKVVPGLGSAVAALYTAAETYALGLTLCAYFARVREGTTPDPEEFQRLYKANYEVGREKLREYLQKMRNPPQDKA